MPGNKKYFITSSAILGKLYSCTMMVVLNSRIVFSHNESASKDLSSSVSNQEISRKTPFPSHGGITVTHEHGQWSIPLESYKIHVSIAIRASSNWYWHSNHHLGNRKTKNAMKYNQNLNLLRLIGTCVGFWCLWTTWCIMFHQPKFSSALNTETA